ARVEWMTTGGLHERHGFVWSQADPADQFEEVRAERGVRIGDDCCGRTSIRSDTGHDQLNLRSYTRPCCQAAERARPTRMSNISRPAAPRAASSARSRLLGSRTGRQRLPKKGAKRSAALCPARSGSKTP